MFKLRIFKTNIHFAYIFGLILCTFFISSTQAGIFGSSNSDGPKRVNEVFVLESQAIEGNQLLLRWNISDDYYLYDKRFKFTASNGVNIKEISRSKTKSKEDPSFGKVEVYYHYSEIVLEFDNVPSNREVELTIGYQGCWDGGVCYPPVTETRLITLPALSESDVSQANKSTVAEPKKTEGDLSVTKTSTVASVSEQDYFSNLLADGDLTWILIAFFVAGLALSLTPCVFPMIPILSSIIAGQGKDVTKTKAFILTLIYVLSVSVTYTLAGVLAGIFGENLQVLFQATWIIVLFSAIFVILSLSMFGFYELQLPAALQSKLSNASNQQQGGNYIGVAIMGVLSALIVGPCMAAPLAGALIYIGQTADPVLGGLALFSLSIGMGVPLLLVGISAGHFMPRAGAWMDKVKAAFGVLLIFMAIYMLSRVVSLQVTVLLASVTIITASVFMGALSSLTREAHYITKLFKALGIIFLLYGVSLLIGFFMGSANLISPLKGLTSGGAYTQAKTDTAFIKVTSIAQLEPVLLQAKQDKKPVILDFYADWCVSCIELEFMFEEPKVAKVLKNIVMVKVDLTDYNEDAKALLTKYKVLGPPALSFYNSNGEYEKNMTTVGVLAAERFLQHIQPLLEQK